MRDYLLIRQCSWGDKALIAYHSRPDALKVADTANEEARAFLKQCKMIKRKYRDDEETRDQLIHQQRMLLTIDRACPDSGVTCYMVQEVPLR